MAILRLVGFVSAMLLFLALMALIGRNGLTVTIDGVTHHYQIKVE